MEARFETALDRGLGFTRNKTNQFNEAKQRVNKMRNPGKRFESKTGIIASGQFGGGTASSSLQGLSTKSSQPNLHGNQNDGALLRELPPVWVDAQEKVIDKIEYLKDQKLELKKLRNQRFAPKLGNDGETENRRLDKQIDDKLIEITNGIRYCESELKMMMTDEFKSENDQKVRKNIQLHFLSKLQDLTKELRQMEKENIERNKELYGQAGEIILNELERREQNFFDFESDQKMIEADHIQELQKHRGEGINKVLAHMNDLAELFKELSILVVHQGTILDRIDYNVQEAETHVNKGNKELQKTLNYERSARAMSCMSCLVVSIIVCSVLLVLKHS